MAEEVFVYECDMRGTKKYGDPSVIEKKMIRAVQPEELKDVWASAASQPKENETAEEAKVRFENADVASEKLLKAAREAFKVKELDEEGNGLTEKRTLKLFLDYWAWVQKQNEEVKEEPQEEKVSEK